MPAPQILILGTAFCFVLYLVIRQQVQGLLGKYHEVFLKKIDAEVKRVFKQAIKEEGTSVVTQEFLRDTLTLFHAMHLEVDHEIPLGIVDEIKAQEKAQSVGRKPNDN